MADTPQYGTKILNGWFDDRPDEKTGVPKHVYRDERGVVVPSVTQILALVGFVDFSKVKREVVERKRQLGSAVHRAAEFLDQPDSGELDWESVHEACVPYVLSYEQTVEVLKLKSHKVETAVISMVYGMKYGCRLDRRGTWGQHTRQAVWEIKCTAQKNLSWRLQTAAQALAEFGSLKDADKEVAAAKLDRFALQLQKDGGIAKIDEHADPRDFRLFISALSLVHFKLANKYTLPEIPDEIVEDENGE